MLGSAVVSLPWAFQQSGLVLGLIISFFSFLISFYTCKLIIDVTGDDPDFADTMMRFYGSAGYYSSLIAPAFLISGAATVYFVIMA
jgi:amino acid permease